MVLSFALIALLFFIFGFVLGNGTDPHKIKPIIVRKKDRELERIKREYENFLNYDGTEQP